MTVQWVAVAAVEFGEAQEVWCDRCQSSARVDLELHGITEHGTVSIGEWSCCEYCDPYNGGVWRCGLCPTVMPWQPAAPSRHLNDAHGGPAVPSTA